VQHGIDKGNLNNSNPFNDFKEHGTAVWKQLPPFASPISTIVPLSTALTVAHWELGQKQGIMKEWYPTYKSQIPVLT